MQCDEKRCFFNITKVTSHSGHSGKIQKGWGVQAHYGSAPSATAKNQVRLPAAAQNIHQKKRQHS
jgi:hypothetical protein